MNNLHAIDLSHNEFTGFAKKDMKNKYSTSSEKQDWKFLALYTKKRMIYTINKILFW